MPEETHGKKQLGLWSLTALVFGNMVGSGTFMLPAALASFGSIGLLAWVVTASGAVVLALVFSRLSKIYPKSGGPYAYCRQAYGDYIGFQIAYCYWIACWIGNAAIIVALIGSLAYFFPVLRNQPYSLMGGLGVLWLVTGINLFGVRQAGLMQIVTAVMKLVPLLAMALIGVFYMDFHALSDFNVSGTSHASAFVGAAALTMWSFIGVESATIPVGEAINPKRNIPLATILGTLLAALVYISSTGVVMGLIPMAELAHTDAPFVLAAYQLFGNWGAELVAIVSVVAIVGTLNGWIFVQAQMPMAAAKDGLFPKLFCRLGARGTPVYGLVISSLLISGLLIMHADSSLVDQFTLITELAVVATLIPYVFSSLAEIVFMLKNPENYRSSRERFKVIALAILAFAFSFFAFSGVDAIVVYYVFLLMLSSVAAYIWLEWSNLHPR